MFKTFILVSLFLHVFAYNSSGRNYTNSALKIGVRVVTKDGNCNGSQPNSNISFPNSGQISAGKQSDSPKKIKFSGIPLVDLGGHFYYFETYFKANFFKAMQFCRDRGMNLLSIESEDENKRISEYLLKHANGIEEFWTSGTDLGEEGKFVWLSTGKYFTFTYWSYPQPDNAGKLGEDCVEIWKLPDRWAWNDNKCTIEFHFICEMKECTDFCS
ncbi:lectin subunit alpha-like [Harmonia axyridis]|uniref:lectin subunit alpha-like n=1 Tax=Harmonia axyridis TaxID=115357 RepID=UPI001E278BE3|nr:lectin subunit alpha-like [Harmonia axyridis]